MLRLTDSFVPIGSITKFDREISKSLITQKNNSSFTEGDIFVPVTLPNRLSILEESENPVIKLEPRRSGHARAPPKFAARHLPPPLPSPQAAAL